MRRARRRGGAPIRSASPNLPAPCDRAPRLFSVYISRRRIILRTASDRSIRRPAPRGCQGYRERKMNHPKRAPRRHGHLPGHIRDTFLAAIEAYKETASGQPLSRIPHQINYRERQISIAEACGLVWGCTDIMPGTEFRSLCDCLTEQPKRQTYAAVAHALLAELKANVEVNAGADARMKRLYDQRDAMIEQLEKAIAAEEGYDLTDRLQRGRAAVAADKAIERWEQREFEDPPPVPATPIEELLRKVYRHCEALRAMEEEMAA
jgi:hypothetical protein